MWISRDESKVTASPISTNWETTIGAFRGEGCQKLRTISGSYPIGHFILQTDDTKNCWLDTKNTRCVTPIVRLPTMRIGLNGCCEATPLHRLDSGLVRPGWLKERVRLISHAGAQVRFLNGPM